MEEKQVIMEAYFDVRTIAGDSIESLLKDEGDYADVGGFEIEVDGKTVPFDFETTAMRFEKDGTCVFGNYEGFLERIYDVDPCHEDIWKEQGLEKEDITAELLASADKLTEFYFNLGNYDETEIPCSLKVKEMSFTNENDEAFSMKPEVLAEFNKQYLAEQYAHFMCKYGVIDYHPDTVRTLARLIRESMESTTPYSILNMIGHVQNSCYEPGIKGNTAGSGTSIRSMAQLIHTKTHLPLPWKRHCRRTCLFLNNHLQRKLKTAGRNLLTRELIKRRYPVKVRIQIRILVKNART